MPNTNKQQDKDPKAIHELSVLTEGIDTDIDYLASGGHNIQRTQMAIEYLNEKITQIISLAEQGDEAKGVQPYPEWLTQNRAKLQQWMRNDNVSLETKGKLSELLAELKVKAIHELSVLRVGIDTDIAYLARGGHNIQRTQMAIEYLNEKITQIISLAEQGDKAKGIQPYPEWLTQNRSTLHQWMQNDNVSPETKSKLKDILADFKAIAINELNGLAEEIDIDIAYLARERHDIQKTQGAIVLLNDRVNKIIALAEQGDKSKGIHPYPEWLTQNRSTLHQWMQNDNVSLETRSKLEKVLNEIEQVAQKAVNPQTKEEVQTSLSSKSQAGVHRRSPLTTAFSQNKELNVASSKAELKQELKNKGPDISDKKVQRDRDEGKAKSKGRPK